MTEGQFKALVFPCQLKFAPTSRSVADMYSNYFQPGQLVLAVHREENCPHGNFNNGYVHVAERLGDTHCSRRIDYKQVQMISFNVPRRRIGAR